jgi:hypothetical protein
LPHEDARETLPERSLGLAASAPEPLTKRKLRRM